MMSNEPGNELLEALRGLEAAARDLRQDVDQPLPSGKAPLQRLEAVIKSLGQEKPARPLRCPEEYVQQWKEVWEGRRERLEDRAVRYLCWEPDVATDPRFQAYLDLEQVDPGSRSLQGLVRACHARWSSEFLEGPVIKKVRRRLENYSGMNRLLFRWKDASSTILGPQGSKEFATHMIGGRQSIKTHCESWGIDGQTPYVREAVRQAVRYCRDQMERNTALSQYLLTELLPWTEWPLEDFKAEIGETILHPAVMATQEIREPLTTLVLGDDRLRDPRLPKNARNWAGVPDEVRLRFIQWLSIVDIGFFFEHVLPDGKDPHGRKTFWLQYVSRILKSRPLLNRDDEARLQTIMQRIKAQIGHFGHMKGTVSSAFLLDFGPIMVAEFSRVGACYVYEKHVVNKVISDFWTPRPFIEYTLKQSNICVERIVHRQWWEGKMAGVLARYGIRPG